jgi:hypothetical protein
MTAVALCRHSIAADIRFLLASKGAALLKSRVLLLGRNRLSVLSSLIAGKDLSYEILVRSSSKCTKDNVKPDRLANHSA